MTAELDYPSLSFDAYKCKGCQKIFQLRRVDEDGPVACPYCGKTDYSNESFEKYMEAEEIQERKQDLDKLKESLNKAVYRSRKL